MVRKHKGREGHAIGWESRGELGEVYGIDWRVQVKRSNPFSWSVKIFAIGEAPRKANYWLPWDGTKFTGGRDLQALVEWRPELLNRARAFMENIHG